MPGKNVMALSPRPGRQADDLVTESGDRPMGLGKKVGKKCWVNSPDTRDCASKGGNASKTSMSGVRPMALAQGRKTWVIGEETQWTE